MSTQEYCGRHSIHYPGRSCPRCDAEERHKELLNAAEESRAETVDAMRESDYRRANPGEHQCPHCLYIALKRGASRCPLCHGDIADQYWVRVTAELKAEEERGRARAAAAAVESARSASARAAAACAAERAAKAVNRADFLYALYFGYLLPVLALVGVVSWASLRTGAPVHFKYDMLTLLVPGLNWLVIVILLLFSSTERVMWFTALLLLALIGVAVRAMAKAS